MGSLRKRWFSPRMVLLCLPLLAQQISPASDDSFESHWTYEYGIEWRLIRAGIAKLTWTPEPQGHKADLHLESVGLVSRLYKVNDDYRTLMNDKLCALSTVITSEEGKRKRETKITYAGGKATYLERDLIKNAVVLSKETPVPPCVYDYFGALTKLRGMKLEPGQSTQVPMSDGKKSADVRVEAQEREAVKTPVGVFKTIRYEVLLFNNVLVNKKARLFIWISDDARRLPVQFRVRLQFLVGTINLQLEKQGA